MKLVYAFCILIFGILIGILAMHYFKKFKNVSPLILLSPRMRNAVSSLMTKKNKIELEDEKHN